MPVWPHRVIIVIKWFDKGMEKAQARTVRIHLGNSFFMTQTNCALYFPSLNKTMQWANDDVFLIFLRK